MVVGPCEEMSDILWLNTVKQQKSQTILLYKMQFLIHQKQSKANRQIEVIDKYVSNDPNLITQRDTCTKSVQLSVSKTSHHAFLASYSGILHSCLSLWARTAFDGFWRTERIRPSEERHPSLFGRWSAGSRVSSKSQPSTKAAVQRMPGSTRRG